MEANTPRRDTVHTRTEVFLDWWDRILVLFGASLVVVVETDTENEVGASESRSHVVVGTQRPQRPSEGEGWEATDE